MLAFARGRDRARAARAADRVPADDLRRLLPPRGAGRAARGAVVGPAERGHDPGPRRSRWSASSCSTTSGCRGRCGSRRWKRRTRRSACSASSAHPERTARGSPPRARCSTRRRCAWRSSTSGSRRRPGSACARAPSRCRRSPTTSTSRSTPTRSRPTRSASSRSEFDDACDRLEAAGIPLVADRDQAWRDFAGWRVNYDRPLVGIAGLVMAPYAPWSSDRSLRYRGPALAAPDVDGFRRSRSSGAAGCSVEADEPLGAEHRRRSARRASARKNDVSAIWLSCAAIAARLRRAGRARRRWW